MNILAYTIVGVISGWLASVFIRERTQGLAEDILIGSMGAVAGGLFAEFSGIAALSFWGSIALSFFGAVLFLFLVIRFSESPRVPIRRD